MKKVIILFLFVSSLFALELNTNKTINANTILVSLEKSNIENPKLTFLNKNYDFFENPFKKIATIFYFQSLIMKNQKKSQLLSHTLKMEKKYLKVKIYI